MPCGITSVCCQAGPRLWRKATALAQTPRESSVLACDRSAPTRDQTCFRKTTELEHHRFSEWLDGSEAYFYTWETDVQGFRGVEVYRLLWQVSRDSQNTRGGQLDTGVYEGGYVGVLVVGSVAL